MNEAMVFLVGMVVGLYLHAALLAWSARRPRVPIPAASAATNCSACQ